MLLILAAEQGRNSDAARKLTDQLTGAGFPVLGVDLRGWGETTPNPPGKKAKFSWDEFFAWRSFEIGRPLLGMRVSDLVGVARKMSVTYRKIYVVGIDGGGLVALHAAALEAAIAGAAAWRPLNSWTDEVGRQDSHASISSFVPGALQDYDISGLIESIAPRPVVVTDSNDPARQYSERAETYMNRFLIVLAIAITAVLVVFSPRGGSAPVTTPGTTVEYLVEFGVDGKADVDWSGSVSQGSARLAGWQFEGGDEIKGSSWKCRTQEQTYWDTPYERRMQPTSHREKVAAKGLLIELNEPANAPLHINTTQGAFDITPNSAPGDAPREFLDRRVRVTSVPVARALTPGPDAEDFPSMIEARDASLWLAYQAYTPDKGDQVYARRLANGVWSEPAALAGAGGDYYRTAIAQDASGKIWVVWSGREGTNFDLYARAYDGKAWGAQQRLTSAENADMNHVMASDAAGHLYLAYQSSRSGNFDIYLRIFDGRNWSDEIQVSSDPANDWEPAVAIAPDGSATILWDTYSAGNYDVVARTWKNGQLNPIFPVAATGAFEAHVSAQYDRQGRLWAAWDQGDWNWGKDYGYEIPEAGRGILTKRQVRVAVFSNGRVQETRSPIAEAVPEESRQVFHRPSLVIDHNGNPWVFFRTRVNLPQSKGYKSDFNRALWRMEATTLRNGKWSRMIEFPHATGRIDLAVAGTPLKAGGVAAVWATDGRDWPTGGPRQQDLQFAMLPAGTPAPPAELVAFQPPTDNLPRIHTEEARDIQRVRAYRATIGGQSFSHRSRRHPSTYGPVLGWQPRRLARRHLPLRHRLGRFRLSGRLRS